MTHSIRIAEKFDDFEGKYLFYLEGAVGGPVFYAESIDEGHEKMKEFLKFGEFSKLVTFFKFHLNETVRTTMEKCQNQEPEPLISSL